MCIRDSYGVDYSQVKIFGADESPAQFKDAFRRINELFITEAKKSNVGKPVSYTHLGPGNPGY